MAKPKEWNEFDKLAKRLVKVPKEKVDRKMATDKQRRLKNVFHEADLVYQGDKWSAVEEAVDVDFTEDAFRTLHVTYMERK